MDYCFSSKKYRKSKKIASVVFPLIIIILNALVIYSCIKFSLDEGFSVAMLEALGFSFGITFILVLFVRKHNDVIENRKFKILPEGVCFTTMNKKEIFKPWDEATSITLRDIHHPINAPHIFDLVMVICFGCNDPYENNEQGSVFNGWLTALNYIDRMVVFEYTAERYSDIERFCTTPIQDKRSKIGKRFKTHFDQFELLSNIKDTKLAEIDKSILSKALLTDSGDIVWHINDAYTLLDYFKERNIVIGGEIFTDLLDRTFEKWSYTINPELSDVSNSRLSVDVAIKNINKYKRWHEKNFFIKFNIK